MRNRDFARLGAPEPAFTALAGPVAPFAAISMVKALQHNTSALVCPHCGMQLSVGSENAASELVSLMLSEGDQFYGRTRIWHRKDLPIGAFRMGVHGTAQYEAFDTAEDLIHALEARMNV